MEIGNWKIFKYDNGTCRLFHDCGFDNYYRSCAKNKNGRWRCLGCTLLTPEDVELLANLCYCESVPKPETPLSEVEGLWRFKMEKVEERINAV